MGAATAIKKVPTFIAGFDQITMGGLPAGRPTLVCGSPGCGKTLFGMEFLLRGAADAGAPGVLLTFEEPARDIIDNVASLGFDAGDFVQRDLLRIDEVYVDAGEITETGDFSLDGLFIRLQAAVDEIGATRVVLDTFEALFAAFSNHRIIRSELARLFRWLKDRGLTTVITAERGVDTLTRYGIEAYVSDCVIVLDHRVVHQVSTRRLRVLKYRGSSHGTNEYPFLIDESGFSILPITAIGLEYDASTERISTGIAGLDELLGNQGYYRGSTVLVSGSTGTGKSSVAIKAVSAAAKAGERSLVFSFEESSPQIRRNMRSIGVDLDPLLEQGLLEIHSDRPALVGLEQHLLRIIRVVDRFEPRLVVIDPISSFTSAGEYELVTTLVVRMIDALKSRGITAVLTYLTNMPGLNEATVEGISSLADTWLLLSTIELAGERNRTMHVIKARGMAHSNQVREFVIRDDGIHIIAPYIGAGTVLTGSARLAQEARDRGAYDALREEISAKTRAADSLQKQIDAEVLALRARLEMNLAGLQREIKAAEDRRNQLLDHQSALASVRGFSRAAEQTGENE